MARIIHSGKNDSNQGRNRREGFCHYLTETAFNGNLHEVELKINDSVYNFMKLDEIFEANPNINGAVIFNSTCYILGNYLKEHIDDKTACVYIQHPNYYGNLEDAQAIGEVAHGAGAKYIMGVNPISLGIIKTPAEYGADVAVGDGQPLGLPLGFGGPYLGFMAATEGMMRKLPGRIVGQTEDHNGKIGYVLTLQAREQHIRREKASSNICSNQALCALAVGVYMSAMGSEGIKEAALQSTSKAHYLAAELDKIGFKVENKGEFFHEFVTVSEKCPCEALKALEEHGILGGYPLGNHRVLWCCTEMNTKEEMDEVIRILKEV